MEVEAVDYFIKDDDLIRITPMRNVLSVKYVQNINKAGVPIKKIDKDHYVDLRTGEVKEFVHSETREQSIISLKRTLTKLRNLINNNFSGKKNELFVTLTFADEVNGSDLEYVGNAFDLFIKRLKYRTKKKWGSRGKFEYIQVKEIQERGAWHFHVLFKFPKLKQVFIDDAEIREIWREGFTKTKGMKTDDGKPISNIGAYLTAYLTDLVVEDDRYISPNDARFVEKKIDGELKRVKKSSRLYLYPSGMNIFARSRGIVDPETHEMTYEEAKEHYGIDSGMLTRRVAVQVSDKERGFTTIVVKEEYVKDHDKCYKKDSGRTLLEDKEEAEELLSIPNLWPDLREKMEKQYKRCTTWAQRKNEKKREEYFDRHGTEYVAT